MSLGKVGLDDGTRATVSKFADAVKALAASIDHMATAVETLTEAAVAAGPLRTGRAAE